MFILSDITMYAGKTIFSQILDHAPKDHFDYLVKKYKGNHRVRSFSCWDQFLCMSFAQLTYRDSLRDVETCLRAQPQKLYHLGIRGNPSRTNIADANQKRDWQIYSALAQHLISQARSLYQDENPFSIDLENTVYALDSSTIDLCLSLFPWAKFRKTKSAVKLHTLLDMRGSIPSYIKITKGSVHDVNVLDDLVLEPGSFYVMDRGYVDFKRLYRIADNLCYFVTRAKKNMVYHRLYSAEVDRSTGLRSDQTIVIDGTNSKEKYPDKLRRVRFYDKETNKYFVFITNNFEIPALIVAELYKNRWKIELFFKWIKQHLKIKKFFGTSFNAVKTQIWIAISVFVLVAIIKKKFRLEMSLYSILQVLSVSVFEKVYLYELLTGKGGDKRPEMEEPDQLSFFDFIEGNDP